MSELVGEYEYSEHNAQRSNINIEENGSSSDSPARLAACRIKSKILGVCSASFSSVDWTLDSRDFGFMVGVFEPKGREEKTNA